ncbi:hypothetical protein LP416_24720 [Polaromonas sp. P2-4]|nr:hypothetical protein LP416_24720 [Polaromonas sp. P2-4]
MRVHTAKHAKKIGVINFRGGSMAFNPGDILPAQYNVTYVLASYVVSVMGSLMALYHAGHIRRQDGSIDHDMVIGAAVSLGGVGIWSMHFIGMLGYKLPVPVVYGGALTFASLFAAVVISGIALWLAGGRGEVQPLGLVGRKRVGWPGGLRDALRGHVCHELTR